VEKDIGERFWAGTKHRRDQRDGGPLDWDARPEVYKEYPQAERIALPAPEFPQADLADVLTRRRSVRTFSAEPMTLQELSNLLWAIAGINRREKGYELRNVPSAGALYPIETYLSVNNVTGLAPGLYHHHIRSHSVELLKNGTQGHRMAMAALDQRMLEECAVGFIWTAVFQRERWKYGQRTYRYVDLDMGHMGQNLALACTASGLGCCHVAAFYDDEVNAILSVDGVEESVVYLSAVGRPR
jgi:SagB-type dehydrogenase family enzyme